MGTEMIFEIPGRESVTVEHVVFDYNGTLAVDGRLIDGVREKINELAGIVQFHVITADTFGSVENAMEGTLCKVVKIAGDNQDKSKLDYLSGLGRDTTVCVGNGKNDRLMLKEAVIGIALLQEEGVCVESLLAADIACKSVLDVLGFFKYPDRLRATLRN